MAAMSPGLAQPTISNSNSQHVQRGADGRTDRQNSNTTSTMTPTGIPKGKNSIETDCGTAKECRAEQREQDNLQAAQASANAAVSQRNAAWWQTGVGAAGVILLVLTVIYTHVATRAAIESVKIVSLVEGPRPSLDHSDNVCHSNGTRTTLQLRLHNGGRTAGVVTSICMQGSQTGLFEEFVDKGAVRHQRLLPPDTTSLLHSFTMDDDEYKFVNGYYEMKSVFNKKPLRDYFCLEFGDVYGPQNENGILAGYRNVVFRIDKGWPDDESATL